MRPGAPLFAAALAAAGAAWAFAVGPAIREGAAAAAAVGEAGPARGPAPGPRWAGPTESEVVRAREAVAALRAAAPPATRPPGLREDEPGSFRGRVRWSEVQDLFAWAAATGRALEILEVRSREDDPDRAECRVLLGAEEPR